MSDFVLQIEQLRSWYGRSQVLWDIDLRIRAGEGLGIVGHNGAGKSTLLRSIAGVHERSQGSVKLLGEEVLNTYPHHIARRGLSIVREGAPVFADLSIVENLHMGAALARRRNRVPLPMQVVWEVFPVLEQMAERKAGFLSGGQRQMLALATAFVSQPSLLLLDEPSAGLAPEAAATAFEVIAKMRDAGLCILIAEQNIEWLAGVTSHTRELESGRMVSGVAGTVA
jgi:branched-chain amino acid transport system ATP-binding protein